LAGLLTVTSLLILVGFLRAGSSGWLAQALLVSAMPVLLILLSCAASPSRLLLIAMTALWILLGSSWAALIWLDGVGVRSLGGVPLVLWILIFGLGLLPLVLVSWVYVATFRSSGSGPVRSGRTASPGSHSESGDP